MRIRTTIAALVAAVAVSSGVATASSAHAAARSTVTAARASAKLAYARHAHQPRRTAALRMAPQPRSLACSSQSFSDPLFDATDASYDIETYSLNYDCAHNLWTATVSSTDGINGASIGDFEVWIDRNFNGSDHCVGDEVYVHWGPGEFAKATETPTCKTADGVDRPEAITTSQNGGALSITFPNSVVGVSTFRWHIFLVNSDFTNADTAPGELDYQTASRPAPCAAPRASNHNDFNGDGKSDTTVFRPSNGKWYVRNVATTAWGANGDQPAAADYNCDGKTDTAVFRPSNGTWYVRGLATEVWGQSGDIAVPGDYNGDRGAEFAVFRPGSGRWYIDGVGSGIWGQNGDIPVPGDYNGDGRTDLAVFRPSTGTWYVHGISTTSWGMNGDIPVAGDYNGDGRTDLAVFRPSTGKWYVRGIATTSWGMNGDIPVAGDYNGDHRTDLTVFRPSTGKWYVRGILATNWGANGDIPV